MTGPANTGTLTGPALSRAGGALVARGQFSSSRLCHAMQLTAAARLLPPGGRFSIPIGERRTRAKLGVTRGPDKHRNRPTLAKAAVRPSHKPTVAGCRHSHNALCQRVYPLERLNLNNLASHSASVSFVADGEPKRSASDTWNKNHGYLSQ